MELKVTKEKVYRIYALSEPNFTNVFYIGCTTCSLLKRLSTHISPSHLLKNTPKNNLINALLSKGIKPEITLILIK